MKSRLQIYRGPLRTRPSKVVCEERLACRGPIPISVIFCEGCRSHQCELCSALLHEDPQFSVHSRRTLIDPPDDQLCDGNCTLRNFAEVNCSSCKSKFCSYCDKEFHSRPKKKNHMRTKFENEEFLSCEGDNYPELYCSSSSEDMMSLSNAEDMPDLLHESLKSDSGCTSFHLLDDREQLQVSSAEEFALKLGCDKKKPVKVLSIFGNTGDGKSHTLNHAFYKGVPVFETSPAQISCTVGAWAAYCPELDIITIDTEGFLGHATNENQRARLLLKVLAISDVIIYRTRAARLHIDMFKFLGDASKAYSRHFSKELEAACARCNIDGPISALGPAVIIFHETINTDVLGENAENILKSRFQEGKHKLDAFSDLKYVGIRSNGSPTNFEPLVECVESCIRNSSIRSARSVEVIFTVLRVLNEKFCVGLDTAVPDTFPDQYFTCPVYCLSCQSRCENSMNHSKDNITHKSSNGCTSQHQFDNKVLLCKVCYDSAQKVVVTPQIAETNNSSWLGYAQYAWSGYVLECPKHGIIYRSRQYWYGNKDPWETCVRTEICHVWPKENEDDITNPNTARYVLDGITAVTDVVSTIGAGPTQYVSSWIADKIAPAYWVPNSKVTECPCGKVKFGLLDKQHHCRMCGGIFCGECSSYEKTVIGWGGHPVRVCKTCYESEAEKEIPKETPPSEVTVRKIGEAVYSVLGGVATVMNYPIDMIKDSARPSYWIPDHLLTECCCCKNTFSPKLPLHHCRACGDGVCNNCSDWKKVPSRGWSHDVRVCKNCVASKDSEVV